MLGSVVFFYVLGNFTDGACSRKPCLRYACRFSWIVWSCWSADCNPDRDQHGKGSLQCAVGSTLFLAVNQISSLPETIGQLTALHILDLEEN